MGIIKKYSKQTLILIVLIQFSVIGYFAYNDNITSISPSKEVVAVVADQDDTMLFIQLDKVHRIFDIPESVHYVNFKNRQVYLFDHNQDYLHTLMFDANLRSYTTFVDEKVEYIDTKFECKHEVCMLKRTQDNNSKIQIFATNAFEYEFLDADNFKWWEWSHLFLI